MEWTNRLTRIGSILAAAVWFCCDLPHSVGAERSFAQILKDAKDEAHQGRNQEAVAEFGRALELNTKCAECYSGRAMAKFQLRDVVGAEADADAAIRLDSKSFPSYVVRGLARADRDDLDGALADLNEAINIYPEALSLYELRANVRQYKGDSAGAFADYTLVIQKTGKVDAYIGRARVKAESGDLRAALADCDVAIGKNSTEATAYAARAHIKSALNDIEGSLADFDQAIRLETNRPNSYSCRGFTKQRAGDSKGALEDFQLAVGSNPTNHDYGSINLWLARCQSGERKKADEELASYLTVRQSSSSSKWALAIMQFLLGKSSEGDFAKEYHSPSPKKEINQRCEFYYYTGMRKLLEKDQVGAKQAFRESTANSACATLCEFANAREQLKALEK